jgi:hypothetical protein
MVGQTPPCELQSYETTEEVSLQRPASGPYGGFAGIRGILVLTFFDKEDPPFRSGDARPCFFVFVQLRFNVIKQRQINEKGAYTR